MTGSHAPGNPSGPIGWADVALGAATAATEVTAETLAGLRSRWAGSGRQITGHAAELRQRLTSLADHCVAQRLAGLAGRGAARRERGRAEATQAARPAAYRRGRGGCGGGTGSPCA